MNLYTWKSNYLKGYRQGVLAALANTPDEAREKLRAEFTANFYARTGITPECVQDDEYFKEQYYEAVMKFNADIAKDPNQSETLFIYGGD